MTRYLPSFSVATGIAGLIVLGLSTDIALAGKRVALVVGNSAYQNVARLPNPEKDATAVAKLFRDAGFDTVVAENNVVALDFKRAIRNFEDATINSDIAVVYYAGHGIEIGGVNYLIPVDAKLAGDRDAQDEAILIERLVQSADEAKRLQLIILDASRDNPFVANMKRRPRTATRAIYSGLGKVEPTGTTTLIAYATKAGSTAEDGDGEHSPFTTALLTNLTTPGLDIRLAFGRVRDQVMKITGGRQEPFVYGSLGGGIISLVPAPEKPMVPDIANVKADYELVAQVGTKKAWEVFLGTYMNGFYADLARAQLAKLGERGDSTPSAAPPKAVASLEPPAPPELAKPTSDELMAWRKLSGTSDKDALAKFIRRYPNSPLALNAKNRLDVLERAAREREEKARAEREGSQQRADEERRAKEAARVAAQQRAEEEQRAKEAARIAELKAKNERRAKELAEAEKQKKEEAARIAAQQSAEKEQRAKEAARIAELKAENERRAKELAEAEKQKKEEAARIAAQQRAEKEQRAKEAARIAELKAENERRAKELAEAEKQKVEMACRNEQARLDDLNAAGKSTSVRDDLKRLSQDLTCERLRSQVVASLDKVDALERAAREREEKARAEREGSQQRADEERRAKEAARVAAQQRAEEEQRAKEAARIAELKAENERRAKELAEAEKQKKEEAARIAAQQSAEKEQRAKEAARIAELKAENERRAKEIAEAENQKKEEAARIAAQQRAEEEQRAKEAARIAELKAENERRAKELAEAEEQKKEEAARIAAQQRAEKERRAKEAARIAELKAENERRAKELAEAEKQKVEMGCRNEQARLDDLNAAGKSTSVRDDLKRLSQDLTCERLRSQVFASLDRVTSELDKSAAPPSPPANTPELVASAQKELARLGCYSGDSDGKLDAATKGAIKKYQAEREQPVTGIAVTDGFVSELRKLKLRVCPAAVVDKPKRNDDRKEARHERSNSSISEPRPQARQQASGRHERSNSSISEPRPRARQQASGGVIGVGF